jgi:hypothetical protein
MSGNFKKTLSDYLKLAQENGIELISEMPKNTVAKARWRCPIGHEWDTTYQNIVSGTNCPTCSIQARRKYFAIDYNNRASEFGYEFIGEVPSNFNEKTRWRCSRGHEWDISLCGLRGCPYCASNGTKLPEDYSALARSKGFEWLGPEVKNSATKTNWRCNNGHEIETTYALLLNHGCYLCIVNRTKNLSDYLELADDRGMIFVGPFPKTTFDRTYWLCPSGHNLNSSYANIRQGTVCPICSGNARRTETDYQDLANKRGFIWMGPSVSNTKTKTFWKCSKGHIWETAYGNIKSGNSCPQCTYEARCGDGNTNWKGGPYKYPDEFNTTLKRKIRRRDGYVCQICGTDKRENHRTLDVHHIVPARYAPPELSNQYYNLITLCRSDHQLCEANLPVSIPDLRNLLSIKYGYQYQDNPLEYIIR